MNDSENELAQLKKIGLQLMMTRKFAAAREHYSDAFSKYGSDLELCLNLGAAHAELGEISESVACFRKFVRIAPRNAMGHLNLARALQMTGDVSEAIRHYQIVLQLDPHHPQALQRLAGAHLQAGDHLNAVSVYKEIADLKPDNADPWQSMGNIYFELGALQEAVSCYRQALSLDPKLEAVRTNLGSVLLHLGSIPEAEVCFQTVLASNPTHDGAIAGVATLARSYGDYTEASSLLRERIAAGSRNVTLLTCYAAIAPRINETQQAIALLEEQLAASSPNQDKALHFYLGQLYDHEDRFDLAFSHFQQGNILKRVKFIPELFEREIDHLMGFFDKQRMAHLAHSSIETNKPVFIVGMLRSGSTLVEQILASHPDITGGGELNVIQDFVTQLGTDGGPSNYPDCLAHLDSTAITNMSQQYLKCIDRIGPGSIRLIDKGLINFLHLGLIELLFPHARVIHCTRHPLDTCLSCYFHDFVGTHHYSYDLAVLGYYYRQYQRLMDHWGDNLTIPIMQVSYEELVADPERQSRSIIEFCRMEWDDRCSRFYESERSVVTSSSEQVRQPVYHSSIGRYRNYINYLDPLEEALATKSGK